MFVPQLSSDLSLQVRGKNAAEKKESPVLPVRVPLKVPLTPCASSSYCASCVSTAVVKNEDFSRSTSVTGKNHHSF